jgi:hypothetical protein
MNRRAHNRKALTLIETTLVVATIALLIGFGLPAVRTLIHSFQSESGTRSMIDAALSSARAMAVKNQCYTGIRFQKRCVSKDPSRPLDGIVRAPQYMIFIVLEEPRKMGNLTIGFRAVEGLEPIRLPETVGVMDLSNVTRESDIDENAELSDATAFSIIFSPSGKVTIHDVRVRNRDGEVRPNNDSGSTKTSMDDIFNSAYNITEYGRGMFIQDDYSPVKNPSSPDSLDYGLGQEPSCTCFVIYDALRLATSFERKTAWADVLSPSARTGIVYVSPYTGTLISSK